MPLKKLLEPTMKFVETEIVGEDCITCGSYLGMGASIDTTNDEFVDSINKKVR